MRLDIGTEEQVVASRKLHETRTTGATLSDALTFGNVAFDM